MQSLNRETIYPNKDVTSTTDLNSRFVYFVCLVSAMGGLLFGYDWVVIGGAKPFYELYFNIADSPSSQGLAMSIALVGCMIGACTCGWLADKIGRKNLLIVAYRSFLKLRFIPRRTLLWWCRHRHCLRFVAYVYRRNSSFKYTR